MLEVAPEDRRRPWGTRPIRYGRDAGAGRPAFTRMPAKLASRMMPCARFVPCWPSVDP